MADITQLLQAAQQQNLQPMEISEVRKKGNVKRLTMYNSNIGDESKEVDHRVHFILLLGTSRSF